MSNTDFIYQKVTDRILAQLDEGTIPWRKPWACKGSAGSPRNFVSKKPYRGINIWLLAGSYETPFWLSFNQARSIKAKVRKGEHGTTVVFWQILKKTDKATKEEKKIFLLRYYTVFNVEQCDDIDPAKIEALKRKVGIIPSDEAPAFNPIDKCVEILHAIQPEPVIRHGGDRACYSPAFDHIQLPKPEDFATPENYYATTFHELIHWTGHGTRLSRDGVAKNNTGFGTERYSKEELVAEFGATFLCAVAGIDREPIITNAAAYIANWRQKLSDDPKLLISAASQAQKAADFILVADEAEGEDDEEQAAPAEALAAA